jgi:cytochrome c553
LVIIGAFLMISASPSGAETRTERYFSLCAICHGEGGAGNRALEAPAIAGLPAWYLEAQLMKYRADGRGKHPGDIGGMRMRPMARAIQSDEDVKQIAAYVAALPAVKPAATVTGDAAAGKVRFAVCIACHGPDAGGNPQMKAPPLTTTNDWYQLTQLKHFKARIRASNPSKDPMGAQMAAIVMGLEDEQVMQDILAYINTLK